MQFIKVLKSSHMKAHYRTVIQLMSETYYYFSQPFRLHYGSTLDCEEFIKAS